MHFKLFNLNTFEAKLIAGDDFYLTAVAIRAGRQHAITNCVNLSTLSAFQPGWYAVKVNLSVLCDGTFANYWPVKLDGFVDNGG